MTRCSSPVRSSKTLDSVPLHLPNDDRPSLIISQLPSFNQRLIFPLNLRVVENHASLDSQPIVIAFACSANSFSTKSAESTTKRTNRFHSLRQISQTPISHSTLRRPTEHCPVSSNLSHKNHPTSRSPTTTISHQASTKSPSADTKPKLSSPSIPLRPLLPFPNLTVVIPHPTVQTPPGQPFRFQHRRPSVLD